MPQHHVTFTPQCHATSRRNVMLGHTRTCQMTWENGCVQPKQVTPSKNLKITFFQSGALDLWPWPSNLSEILSQVIFTPNFRSVSQTVQPWERWQTDRQTHTHTHTHRRDRFYTLDRWKWKFQLTHLLLLVLQIKPILQKRLSTERVNTHVTNLGQLFV